MSRTPVREATLILESQGLLEVRPRKGVRISALSADDMREIYEVLTELESLAASLAAEAHYSEEQLAKLEGRDTGNGRQRGGQRPRSMGPGRRGFP